ncbi:MAG TPA: Spy/CpxP family protein refolding chaperone [Thermoanaerobaculia bacterium]|jgi:Spy/CpxP family protein refolding chaperone
MKRILTLSFAAVLLLAAGIAWSEGPVRERIARMHHDMHEHFGEDLNLTDEQKAAAKKLHEEVAAKAEPLLDQHHQQWREIHEMLDAGNADATEIGRRMIAAHAIHQQVKALHDEAETRFAALLTAEQLEKFKEHQERRREGGPHRFFFHPGPEH